MIDNRLGHTDAKGEQLMSQIDSTNCTVEPPHLQFQQINCSASIPNQVAHHNIAKTSLNCEYLSTDQYSRQKQSIRSKGKNFVDKNYKTSIHHKYAILSKMNHKLSSCVKLITQQIRNDLLKQIQTPKLSTTQQEQAMIIPKVHSISNKPQVMVEKIHPDKEIVKQSCFRGLLKATQIDNDIPSDEQDLNMGIRYMYGELLYSVGSEMVNQRQKQKPQKTKPISKKIKKVEQNKQNINTNNMIMPQDDKSKARSFNQSYNNNQLNRSHLNVRI